MVITIPQTLVLTVYRQYETSRGSRVIAEHTGEEFDHFHLGQPKDNASRNFVNFGWGGANNKEFPLERYSNPDNHHYYSTIVTNVELRAERGLSPLKGK